MLKPHQTSLSLPWACLHGDCVSVSAHGMCVPSISVPVHLLIGGQRGYLYKGHEVSFQVCCMFIHAWLLVCARAWAFSLYRYKGILSPSPESFQCLWLWGGKTRCNHGKGVLLWYRKGVVQLSTWQQVFVPMATVKLRYHSTSHWVISF